MERKRAVLAGSWYPGSSGECTEQIQEFLRKGPVPRQGDFPCGIVPHAGWFFSGSMIQSLDDFVMEDPFFKWRIGGIYLIIIH